MVLRKKEPPSPPKGEAPGARVLSPLGGVRGGSGQVRSTISSGFSLFSLYNLHTGLY